MFTSALTSGGGLSAYLSSFLAQGGTQASPDTAADNPAVKAAAQAALATAAHRFKASAAQHTLDDRQTTLATDLRAAMAKAGVTLSGPVEFSIGSNGALAISGSDKDKAAATAFLKSDASKPGFASKLTALAKDADALSGTIRQSAAISQAARYAGGPGNVLSLYATLLKQQDASPATFSFSGAGSSLTYPGVLASTA